MNQPVYLGFSILEISKTSMYEFLYDYIKPKYQNNAKLCYIDTDSFIIQIKTEDVYEDIGDDVKNGLAHHIIVKMIKDHLQEVTT